MSPAASTTTPLPRPSPSSFRGRRSGRRRLVWTRTSERLDGLVDLLREGRRRRHGGERAGDGLSTSCGSAAAAGGRRPYRTTASSTTAPRPIGARRPSRPRPRSRQARREPASPASDGGRYGAAWSRSGHLGQWSGPRGEPVRTRQRLGRGPAERGRPDGLSRVAQLAGLCRVASRADRRRDRGGEGSGCRSGTATSGGCTARASLLASTGPPSGDTKRSSSPRMSCCSGSTKRLSDASVAPATRWMAGRGRSARNTVYPGSVPRARQTRDARWRPSSGR